MHNVVIIAIIALVSIVIGTMGFDYFNEYVEKRDLENFIVSCMEQYGHDSDELVNCLNDNSFSNP
jgi:nitrate/TMAO reductase-like tetraheme cytochrome c subunit